MTRIPLLSGSYSARSVIASSQRNVNLFAEINPQTAQTPEPVTHYQTPGLNLLIPGNGISPVRCTYRSSKGDLYRVVGGGVYYVNSAFDEQLIGTISTGTTPVSMKDNGLAIVIVDGGSSGWAIDMASLTTFGQIPGTNFYGATTVDYVDTFFLFNRPDTAQMYISASNATYAMLVGGTAFDSLDIAAKTGAPDPIAALIVMHREIWLVGTLTTEIWFNSGAADFTFQALPGAFIEHGTVAPYSVVKQDLSIYWLSQDLQGQAIFMRGSSYQAERISTHAIENEVSKYTVISDCVAYSYQQEGHTFIVFNFPTANKSWAYDQSTEQWHERAYTDNNGILNRSRVACVANVYGKIVAGDWQNGNLYELDMDTYTDNGQPISRIRAFPLMINEAKRVVYNMFIADMEVGEDDASVDGSTSTNPPVVSLRWSNDRGKTWGNRVEQSIGAVGEYGTCVQFQRTGMARYRVFELSWSAPCKTALNGAYVADQSSLS